MKTRATITGTSGLLCALLTLTACTSPNVPSPSSPSADTSSGATTTSTDSSSTDPARPFNGTRPANVIFPEFLNTIEDIAQNSGTTFPDWDRAARADYNAGACGVRSREDGRKYTTQIEGGSIADPAQAVEKMKTYWQSKGYTIGNIFPYPGDNALIALNATTPSGIFVRFSPSKGGTLVDVQSDCTLDPAARETSTETIP